MERLSRYGRRMRITLIKTMTVACFVCIIAIPFLSKKLLKTEANYYSITINGIKVGAANTEEEVIVALASARQELSAQYEEIVYMDPDIEIAKENKAVAQRMSVDGEKADVKSIQGLTGVKLSQGTHIITMKYQTPGLKTGAVLSILMVGILGAICFARKFRNR